MIPSKPKHALLALGIALLATPARSQVALSVTIAPPPLPLYAQPPIPADGYIWTPGYWAWDPIDGDYHWVPGTWVLPPGVGLLWTPGYWAYTGVGYFWHGGYWGPHVGYYGGLNYGYGYNGRGYWGGHWAHGHLRYNGSVNNLPPGRTHDVYQAPVAPHPGPRDSYNGGDSRYRTVPSAEESRHARHPRGQPTPAQMEQEHRALTMPEQRMSYNHGVPPTAATQRPGGFGDPAVEHARPAPMPRGNPAPHAGPVIQPAPPPLNAGAVHPAAPGLHQPGQPERTGGGHPDASVRR